MPVTVSPLIRFSRYAALVVGLSYGYKHNDSLKVRAAHDREVESKQANERDELKQARQAAEDAKGSIFDQ